MNRFFTFGCSFTDYVWPTWADIIGKGFDEHQNWGGIGGGNLFIFCRLMEAIKKESISKKDTVAIMWSSINREDRWVNGQWVIPGNIYNQDVYDKKWVETFADPTGYLIRDLALITAATNTLENIGCKYYMMSMMPISKIEKGPYKNAKTSKKELEMLQIYDDVIDRLRPSVFDVIFNGDWNSRPWTVKNVYKSPLSKFWDKVKGQDWPTLENWLTKRNIENIQPDILEEISDPKWDWKSKLCFRFDNHPTPMEHLEYVQKVLPEFNVDQSVISLLTQMDDSIIKYGESCIDEPWEQWMGGLKDMKLLLTFKNK